MRPYVSTKNVPKNGHICSRLNIFYCKQCVAWCYFIQQHNKTEVGKKDHIIKDDTEQCNKRHIDLQQNPKFKTIFVRSIFLLLINSGNK